MSFGTLIKNLCAALALIASLFGWLVFLIDPVLVIFTLYTGILFSGFYAIFPSSKTWVYTLGISAAMVVAIFASHYTVKEGFSPFSLDSIANGLGIVIPPLIITGLLILISTVKRLRAR